MRRWLLCLLCACSPPGTPLEVGEGCAGAKCDDVDDVPGNEPGAGTWSRPTTAPVHFLHGALMHTGRVVLFSALFTGETEEEYAIWDPETNAFTVRPLRANLVCSHHAHLPNGDLLLMGGGANILDQHTWALRLDAQTEDVVFVAPMNTSRWYPTVVPMPDGRLLVGGGHYTDTGDRPPPQGMPDDVLEQYDAATGEWTEIEGSDRIWSSWYPALQLLPGGDVLNPFALGFPENRTPNPGTQVLRFTGPDAATWETTDELRFTSRQEGAAVTLVDDSGDAPVARVMVIGGGVEVSGTRVEPSETRPKSVEVMEVGTDAEPTWRRAADMAFSRTNVSAVVLPNGRVMAIGGHRGDRRHADTQRAVLQSEVYDFDTDAWETTASFRSIVAQYHNVSMLLPDGRVFSGGGNNPALEDTQDNANQREFEVFSPGYTSLLRPVIVDVPQELEYGAEFEIEIEVADDVEVDEVTMVKPSSVTHHTDAGGRFVRLASELSDDGTSVVARAPRDGSIMPPGWVMLFVLADDVPSVAAMVRVGPPRR